MTNLSYAFLVAVGCLAALAGTLALRRVKRARFEGRRDLSGDEFYESYYRDSGLPKERVVLLREVLAEELEIPAGRIRPSDRFSHELQAAEGWEGWDDGIEMLRLSARSGKGRRELDWAQIRTLDDFIRAACE